MKKDSPKHPENQDPSRGVQQNNEAAEVKKTSPADKAAVSGRSREIADIRSAINRLPEVRDTGSGRSSGVLRLVRTPLTRSRSLKDPERVMSGVVLITLPPPA
jgi:hypothetical protein